MWGTCGLISDDNVLVSDDDVLVSDDAVLIFADVGTIPRPGALGEGGELTG